MTTATITYLDLSSNKLSDYTGIYNNFIPVDKGIPVLIKAIEVNTSITNLNLSDNELIDRDMSFCQTLVKKHIAASSS